MSDDEAPPDRAFAAALAALPGIGPASLRALLAGAPARRCHAQVCAEERLPLARTRGASGPGGTRAGPPAGRDPARLGESARRQDVAELWRRLRRAGITVLCLGDAGYPARLAADPEPPAVLFALGQVPGDELPTVALVGTRSCTHYGEQVAAELAAELAARGVVVVSGLAAGIDAAAHSGVLAAARAGDPTGGGRAGDDAPAGTAPRGPGRTTGPPLAIVGGGVDVVYPASNAALWRAVAGSGAILSESPPGSRPEAWRFPARNRLLAGASDLVVVVESHRRGGALMTAEAAIRRQVPVAAVPGSVRSPASAGCNDLLADGAHVVRDADDVLAILGLATPRPAGSLLAAPAAPARNPASGSLDPDEEVVLAALEDRPLTLDTVLARVPRGLLAVVGALERLAGRGLVRQAGTGWELA